MVKTVPVTLDHDTTLPVARIEALAAQVQLVFPESADEAMEEVVRLEEKKQLASVKQGLLLLQVKQQCGHGEFSEKLKAFSLSNTTVKECMAIAKMFLSLSDPNGRARDLLGMNHSQLRELAKLPVQLIEQLDEDTLDGLAAMSSREMVKEVKKLRLQKAEAEDQAAAAINELNLLQLQTQQTERMGWPVHICTIRDNCLGLSSVAAAAVDQAAGEVNTLINTRHFTPEQRLAAARAVWHSWFAVNAQLTDMLAQLATEFDGQLAGFEHLPSFTPQEWENAMGNRQYMLAMYQFNQPEHTKKGAK